MRRIGPYEIRQKFGEGGMGVVYKARDRRHGQDVALKVLHQRLQSDPEGRARFLREAEVLEGLDHPNLAKVYESGEAETSEGPMLYLAMEFVPGRDLYYKLSFEELEPITVVEIGQKVASALAAAHEAGIVHRDLKPSNVRVSRDGKVKVLDFGLAKIEEADRPELPADVFESGIGMMVGTAAYASPEQLRGERVDARADLYSLGVLLYQLTTGRLPFRSIDRRELLKELENREPEPMSHHGVAAAPGLEDIVRRLLRCAPDERYGSASEVEAELTALAGSMAASGGGTLDDTSVPLTPVRSWRGLLLGVGIAVVIIALAWVILSLTGILP